MKTILGMIIVLLALALVVLWPFALVWSLNTLFPSLAIPYDFWTWLAALTVIVMIQARVQVKRD